MWRIRTGFREFLGILENSRDFSRLLEISRNCLQSPSCGGQEEEEEEKEEEEEGGEEEEEEEEEDEEGEDEEEGPDFSRFGFERSIRWATVLTLRDHAGHATHHAAAAASRRGGGGGRSCGEGRNKRASVRFAKKYATNKASEIRKRTRRPRRALLSAFTPFRWRW